LSKITRILSLILLTTMLLTLFSGCGTGEKAEPPTPVEEEIEEEEKEEEEEEEEEKVIKVEKVNPVTVVINNHPSARPQSGLQQASRIYEFLVESGMTRFLAVYDTSFEEDFTIGPVRSLRPYLGVKAAEYGGIVAHSGYSHRTREMIRGLGLKEIVSSTYLWRDSSRRAPHNLYTSINKLHSYLGDNLETEKIEIEPEELTIPVKSAPNIKVEYSNNNIVTYEYGKRNEDKGVYLRFINEIPHKDLTTGKQYYAQRVIVQKVPHSHVPGTALVDIKLEGRGEGLLYEKGKKYSLTWENKEGTTSYYYEDGSPVELDWGTTWIQIVKSL